MKLPKIMGQCRTTCFHIIWSIRFFFCICVLWILYIFRRRLFQQVREINQFYPIFKAWSVLLFYFTSKLLTNVFLLHCFLVCNVIFAFGLFIFLHRFIYILNLMHMKLISIMWSFWFLQNVIQISRRQPTIRQSLWEPCTFSLTLSGHWYSLINQLRFCFRAFLFLILTSMLVLSILTFVFDYQIAFYVHI